MTRLADKRRMVRLMMKRPDLSERRACRLAELNLSTWQYRPCKKPGETRLRVRLSALANQHPRYGYHRLHVLLAREGIEANHKRIHRLYRLEGLQVRQRKRKRIARVRRTKLPAPTAPNQQWSLDFQHDGLGNGRRFKCLNIVDDCTREYLAIEVDTSIGGARMARVLDRLVEMRGLPVSIVMDNGPEMHSKAMDEWAYRQGVKLDFITPGRPVENAYIERLPALRLACLRHQWPLP